MGLEKILNPYVADSVAGFSMGFIQGMRHSKFNKYSDYYDSKQLKEINNKRLLNSILYGSILPVVDFLRNAPIEKMRYEFATGIASSLIGFESGKFLGSILYKNNDKLNRNEQERLAEYSNKMKEATKQENILELFKNSLECHEFVLHLGKKKPNRRLRENIEKQMSDTINYCHLYHQIRGELISSRLTTIVVGMPQYPKAHALIINEGYITDLTIQFEHYSMIKRDNIPLGELNVKPNLSKKEIKWDRDIDKLINMADSYRKDNSVMIIVGGRDECPTKKEIDASIKFTVVYTEYLYAKHLAEKIIKKK